eukprot:PhF_6_TR38170/c0_g1_i1/m.57029/K10393/KIF2_24, MCAK; kinesin family member 2/24
MEKVSSKKKLQLAALNEKLRQNPRGLNDDSQPLPHTSRAPIISRDEDGGVTSNVTALPTTNNHNISIHVAVRKRPLSLSEEQIDPTHYVSVDNNTQVQVNITCKKLDLTPYTDTHTYDVDAVYDQNATNVDVYRRSVSDLVRKTIEHGGRAAIFTFGTVGSGKTHMMYGSEYEPGLYRMVAGDVFRLVSPGTKVFLSMFELYGASIFDLLEDGTVVQCMEDGNGDVNFVGATEKRVDTAKQLSAAVAKGSMNRHTRVLGSNENSSSSHAVLVITLRGPTEDKITLVDLAGSGAESSKGETKEINRSLLALKECIRALDCGNARIPFRTDKLTELLKQSFTGRCPTVMLSTVSPYIGDVEGSHNTVRYAHRVCQMQRTQRTTTHHHKKSQHTKDNAYGLVKSTSQQNMARPMTPNQQSQYEITRLKAELNKKDAAHQQEIRMMQDRIRQLMRENERLRRRY